LATTNRVPARLVPIARYQFNRMHTKIYNVCMETQKYTVLRIRKTTRDTLKLVSVLSHESMGKRLIGLHGKSWLVFRRDRKARGIM